MNVAALTPVSSSAAARSAARTTVAPRGQPLTGAALRNAPEAVQRAEVSAQFEAILLRQLIAPTMTSMLGSDSGAAAGVYGDLLTDTLAQQMSRGGGLGLAQVMARQLAPRTPAAPAGSPSTPSKS